MHSNYRVWAELATERRPISEVNWGTRLPSRCAIYNGLGNRLTLRHDGLCNRYTGLKRDVCQVGESNRSELAVLADGVLLLSSVSKGADAFRKAP